MDELMKALTYREQRKSSLYLFFAIVVEFLFLLGDAASFYNLAINPMPIWLMYITYFLSYISGLLAVIPFSLYSATFIREKTPVKRGVYQIPIVLSLVSVLIAVAAILSGSVYGVVDGKMAEINGLPAITGFIQIFVAVYLPIVAFVKSKVLGLKTVMLLGLFGIVPVVLYFISYNFAGIGTALSLIIVYVLLQSDTSAEKEKQRKELTDANEEKLAQIEEITALNAQLAENQAQLEEAAVEQEAQIEEVNALNTELMINRTRLEKQLAIIGATSQRYFCVYYIEVETHQFKEIFCPPNMHAVLGAEGDAILPLELVWKKLVIPEDQESMHQFNNIANWNDFLGSKDMYSREYRGVTSGWSRATLFAVSRDSDGNVTSVVYASEMIHEQKEAEVTLASQLQEITLLNSELEEHQAQLEESTAEQEAQLEEISTLNADLEKKSMALKQQLGIVGSLANTFQALYFVDMTDGSFVELGKSREQVENVIGKKGNAKASFEAMCNYLVIPEHKEDMETFTDLSTIQERLGSRLFISHQYCGQNGVWSEGFFVSVSRDEAGSITGLLWGVRIIDEFKKKEIKAAEELTRAKEEAEAANNAKTSFLFNMSHDIRTPMNAIMGFRDLLEKHQENPERRADYLKKIEESSSVLLSIINNVLEMARIEKGTIEIDESAWSAEQFNDTLYSIFQEMMIQKGITFARQIDVKNPYVYCDPIKLREVFINILSNAYKYTNAGGSVNMHLEEIPSDREGYAMYRTTITDTGIGMSEEFLPHIFEEFSRENSTTDNKIEGTGLGMPIVKRLVDLMEGTIEVRSEKGAGSTFIVTIPHRITEKSSLVEHAGVEIDPKLFVGKRILLAEDNELNAEIATEILGEAGFIVDRAEDGVICCKKLSAATDNYYDLILMDIQMPNMNGYDAARTIRKMTDSAKANIPILAMTANAFEEDKREALRAGMNEHLSKPINVTELMKALAGILG